MAVVTVRLSEMTEGYPPLRDTGGSV